MDDNMTIKFVGEAYESFQTALRFMTGYGVSIKLPEGEPFDAILIGPDINAEDGATVRFIRVVDGEYETETYPQSAVESAVTEWIEVS